MTGNHVGGALVACPALAVALLAALVVALLLPFEVCLPSCPLSPFPFAAPPPSHAD